MISRPLQSGDRKINPSLPPAKIENPAIQAVTRKKGKRVDAPPAGEKKKKKTSEGRRKKREIRGRGAPHPDALDIENLVGKEKAHGQDRKVRGEENWRRPPAEKPKDGGVALPDNRQAGERGERKKTFAVALSQGGGNRGALPSCPPPTTGGKERKGRIRLKPKRKTNFVEITLP